MLNLSMSGKMSGHGKMIVKRGDGTVEEYADNNKLLASFFTKANTGSTFSITPRLKVGTGTTATEANTTQLAAVLPPASGSWPTATVLEEPTGTLVESGTKIRSYIKYQLVAGVGQFVGNISEYGLNLSNDSTTNSGIVDTRVLITDVDGNPTTITLGLLDQLICEYTFQILIPYEDIVTTVTAQQDGADIDYEITMRLTGLYKFSTYMNLSYTNQGSSQSVLLTQADIGEIGTALPASNNSSQDTVPGLSITGSGDKRSVLIDIPISKGNLVGGIKGLTLGARNNWYKVGFNPPLPKALNNNIKFTLNLSHTQ